MTVLEEVGNPLLEGSQDLLVTDTRDIMDTQVAEIVRRIETLDKEQYAEFVTEKLEECTAPVTHEKAPFSKIAPDQ